MTDEQLDVHLDKILKAAGSALKHYSMQKTKDDMRQALREALAQPEQEPVAYLCEPDENGLYGLPLTEKTCTKCFPVYRHSQRTWVGLTDEEIDDIWNRYCDEMGDASINDAYDISKAIEAKLKQKNGYAEEKNT